MGNPIVIIILIKYKIKRNNYLQIHNSNKAFKKKINALGLVVKAEIYFIFFVVKEGYILTFLQLFQLQ